MRNHDPLPWRVITILVPILQSPRARENLRLRSWHEENRHNPAGRCETGFQVRYRPDQQDDWEAVRP